MRPYRSHRIWELGWALFLVSRATLGAGLDLGLKSIAHFSNATACANFDREVSKSGHLWILLFKKTYCPWCADFDFEWQAAALDLRSAPRVRMGEVDMHKCPQIAARYGARSAPTTVLATRDASETYTGSRTAQGLVAAARQALSRWRVALVGDLDPLVPITVVDYASLDPVLLVPDNCRPEAWVLQVSRQWPPSPSLLTLSSSLGVRAAFAVHEPNLLARLEELALSFSSSEGAPSDESFLLFGSRPLGTALGTALGTSLEAPACTSLDTGAEAVAEGGCAEWVVLAHALYHRMAPAADGKVAGVWQRGHTFLAACDTSGGGGSGLAGDPGCAWLRTCRGAATYVTRLGPISEAGQVPDVRVQLHTSAARPIERISMQPGPTPGTGAPALAQAPGGEVGGFSAAAVGFTDGREFTGRRRVRIADALGEWLHRGDTGG
mmetsp:Transcript_17515/g.40280  ORF Transcript_17515/g.40280 Transcript_17515/m.40280 type:complete len:438 (+) Transcript_17515:59-1372(+)